MKVEKNALIRNRLFFKDFDGSLVEVPQSKMRVSGKTELRRITKAIQKGGANCYGTERDLNELVRNTRSMMDDQGMIQENPLEHETSGEYEPEQYPAFK